MLEFLTEVVALVPIVAGDHCAKVRARENLLNL